jgi:hypothetical protein
MFSTVRIESINQSEKGEEHSYGTGFIFDFFRTPKGNLPVIVSNRHVVEGSLNGKFLFNRVDSDGRPVFSQPVPCDFNEFEQNWIFHPNANVDLAIMPIGRLFERLFDMGSRVYYSSTSSSTIPNNEEWEEFHVFHDILVIGYPYALMDHVNNLPIFRKGTTATHPNIPYEGNDEFLVDVAIFRGSSGSPVFLLNEDFYRKSTTLEEGRDKVRLLGIIRGGFMITAEGIIIEDDPNEQEDHVCIAGQRALYEVPVDLGVAIKSSKLKDFEPILRDICARRGIELLDD